ncbi:Glutathione synthetase [Candidatus Erwinia haradaeae]|uniref:Glutathione synthetase n=1 Tax=Candidatus Erwinia haradaeae TaxID=1922217 RepID=A0A451CZH2_9GAMM|nr:glutathione synthase [Candidatus Erwinia haradaeae]VFP78592.1 Glutathione synthetase [Candidatus Erwinia haradaeae]
MFKLGLVMDPITSINFNKDSTLAMLQEAQKRCYEIYYMEISDLYLHNDEGRARTRILKINNSYPFFTFSQEQDIQLSKLNVILMRKNPPLDSEFIYATYILERAEKKGTLIINKPQSLRDYNEKLFTTWFPDLIPETLVTQNSDQIRIFWKKHQNIILKPLDRMGGASVFYIKPKDPNISVIIETITNYNTRYCIAQAYLPAIKDGDKRVIIVDGKSVPYCLARIPKPGETRGNLSAGAYSEVRHLSSSDYTIVEKIIPTLNKNGLIFVGLDIIGDKLTEINITSPTGIREIEAAFPISITDMLMNSIEKKILNASSITKYIPTE